MMSATLSFYCRFCAEQKLNHELIDLTSDQKTRHVIVEKLSIFNSHSVDFSINTLPETVCLQCVQSLDSTHEFFSKIKMSQFVLSNLVLTLLKTDTEVCDHSFDYPDTEAIKYESVTAEIASNHLKTEYDDFNKVFEMKSDPVGWSNYPWFCKHCNMQAKGLGALRQHCKEVHGVCFTWYCSDCKNDIFVNNFDDFVEHVIGHRSELNHFCHHCNMKLEPQSRMDHLTAHKNQPHCHTCGEVFADEFMLHAHLSTYQKHDEVSWTEYEWVCKLCDIKLMDQESLRMHVKEVHNKCFGMQCADCPEAVDSFNAFVDHVRVHKPSLKFYCQYCNQKFLNAEHTILHLSEHLNYQCDICGESFQNRMQLRSHRKKYDPKFKKHGNKLNVTEQDLTCNVCQKVAKSVKNLQIHKTLHMDRKREYTCERCGKAFFTKGALNSHNVIHENPVPEVCEICNKTFLTRTRLRKHVKTHCPEKSFRCDVCQRCFRLKDQLKSHMACHSDAMPFSCQYCEKTFRYRNVLKIHENQHTGARPYSCFVCDMVFANWSNCNKHMIRKHGTPLAKNVITPQGKLPINPKTGKPKKVQDLELVREWTEQVLRKRKTGRKK